MRLLIFPLFQNSLTHRASLSSWFDSSSTFEFNSDLSFFYFVGIFQCLMFWLILHHLLIWYSCLSSVTLILSPNCVELLKRTAFEIHNFHSSTVFDSFADHFEGHVIELLRPSLEIVSIKSSFASWLSCRFVFLRDLSFIWLRFLIFPLFKNFDFFDSLHITFLLFWFSFYLRIYFWLFFSSFRS